MKVVVAFSAGTDSVSALLHSIEKYGKENVIAFLVLMQTKMGRDVIWQAAQRFYAEKICAELGVELIVHEQRLVPTGENIYPDIYVWMPPLIHYCITNKEITEAVYGHSADDRTHEHVLLWWNIFEMCMKTQKRNVVLSHPLSEVKKKDCYAMIPETLRPYIWTCIKPTSTILGRNGVKGYVQCGECAKCKEFKVKIS